MTKDKTSVELSSEGRQLKRGLTQNSRSQLCASNDYDLLNKSSNLELRSASQLVKNYQMNVLLLADSCSSCTSQEDALIEQMEVLFEICRNLKVRCDNSLVSARCSIDQEKHKNQYQAFEWLEKQKKQVDEFFTEYQTIVCRQIMEQKVKNNITSCSDKTYLEQEKYLNTLSNELNELQVVSTSIGQSMDVQSRIMNTLDLKTDEADDKVKLAVRRAGRLTQKRAWKGETPRFQRWIVIHCRQGYVSVLGDNIVLTPKFQGNCSIFGLWERQGNALGLQNKMTRRWVGQSTFGYVVCSAFSFKANQEWEFESDENETYTRIICSSANWGCGGYLHLNKKGALDLRGNNADDKKSATLWTVEDAVGGRS